MILIGGLSLSSGLVRDAAAVRLQGSVDRNWRGAYDILVRPAGVRLDLERTNGLVEPNFLSFSGRGGISFRQLEQIREISDVEVAAPLATIGNMRYVVTGPVVFTSYLPERPTLYRMTVTVSSSDGIEPVLVHEQTIRVLLGPADLEAPRVPFVAERGSMSWGSDGVAFFLDPLPPIASPVIGVDPVAERELLGAYAGFLDAFGPITAMPRAPTVTDFPVSLIAPQFADQESFISALASGPDAATTGSRPVIPVAVSHTLYASLDVRLQVEQLGEPLDAYPSQENALAALDAAAEAVGPGVALLGETTLDASALLRPLQRPLLTMLWPRSAAVDGQLGQVGVAPELLAGLAARPIYDPIEPRPLQQDLSFRIEAVGATTADGEPASPDGTSAGPGGSLRGVEAAYRRIESVELPPLELFRPSWDLDRPFVFAPIAEFDLGALELPDNPLNYVPLGAYAPPDTRLVAGPDGDPKGSLPMRPTLNPTGLITVPPLAITDLRSAAVLRGNDPIDAVRVRVANLDRFDAVAIRSVERVATAIAELGLDVDIVAGSSPQAVEIYVPSYRFESGDRRDLGWVEQGWTTLGAAERVERGLSDTNIALLGLGMLTGVTFAAGLQLLQSSVRTREAAILRALGWDRRRVLVWMSADAVVAGAVITLAGLATWALTGRSSDSAALAGLVLGGAFPLAALGGAAVATRTAGSDGWQAGDVRLARGRLSVPVDGVRSYGLRAFASHPLRGASIVLALGIAAASTSVGAVVVIGTAATVGPTRLATELSAVLNPYQLAILGLTAVAAGLLAVMMLRMDVAARREEFVVLSASGWDRRAIREMLTVHRLLLAIPAAGLAAGLAGAAAIPLGAPGIEGPAVLAAFAAGAALLIEAHMTAPRVMQ